MINHVSRINLSSYKGSNKSYSEKTFPETGVCVFIDTEMSIPRDINHILYKNNFPFYLQT